MMNKVKAARERKQLSRYKVAKATGVGYSTLMAVERGGDVKLSTLDKIAKVLKVPLKELI